MTRTVVIGAGVAGLATAALLAAEGHDVEVLERNDEVGGRAGSLTRDGFRFDTGPSWFLMPEVFDRFFALLGTSTEEQLDLRLLDPGYRIFPEPGGDEPFTVPLGEQRVLEAFEARSPGSAEELRRYLVSAREASALATDHFLYNPFTDLRTLTHRDILRRAPRLARLLGTSLESFVTARFTDPVLRQALGYPAVFLGTSPADAPAIYHLMSALDLGDGVAYPMGGFHELVNRLHDLAVGAGARITTGSEVTHIDTMTGGRRHRAQAVIWRDTDGAPHRSATDVVVSAADLHHTETRLLDPEARSYPEAWWRRRTSGPGAVLVLLGVEGTLPQLPHHSLFFARDWGANFDAIFGRSPHVPDPASMYVCRPSATDPDVAPPGQENLFVLVPVPADPGLGSGGPDGTGSPAVEAAADAAIARIAEWAGIDDLADRIVVRHTIGPGDFADSYNSWMGGMLGPAHVLSQSAMFRAGNRSKRVENLFYAGGTTSPGVGVPMCLISAELVLKHLRGDRTAGPLPRPAGVRA